MVQNEDIQHTECENVRSYLWGYLRRNLWEKWCHMNSSFMFTQRGKRLCPQTHQPCVYPTRSETAREPGDHYRSYSWTAVWSKIRDGVRLRWLLKWPQCVPPPTSRCLLHTRNWLYTLHGHGHTPSGEKHSFINLKEGVAVALSSYRE